MLKFPKIFLALVFLSIPSPNLFLFAQPIYTLKLTTTKFDHLFSKDTIPSFVLKIDALKNTDAQLEIKFKAITEKKFFIIIYQKFKLEKGTTTDSLFPEYKWWPGFYEIYAGLKTRNGPSLLSLVYCSLAV